MEEKEVKDGFVEKGEDKWKTLLLLKKIAGLGI